MEFQFIVQFIFFAFLLYLVFKTYQQSKTNKKMSGIIQTLRAINDQDKFFQLADNGITTSTQANIKTKYQVLKLWGLAMYAKYEEYDSLLNEIHLADLYTQPKMSSDDSLFYMTLAIPNILQKDGEYERIQAILNKVLHEVENADQRLDYTLGLECVKFYTNREDKGIPFMENVFDGNYESVTYNKSFISMYKQIIACNLLKYYQETDHSVDEYTPMVNDFSNTHIGSTWINNIQLTLSQNKEDSSENVIDAEVNAHPDVMTGDDFESKGEDK